MRNLEKVVLLARGCCAERVSLYLVCSFEVFHCKNMGKRVAIGRQRDVGKSAASHL
jgi:hypothetical protein